MTNQEFCSVLFLSANRSFSEQPREQEMELLAWKAEYVEVYALGNYSIGL
jgi:hypothetical protein